MSELVGLVETVTPRFRGGDDWFVVQRTPGVVAVRVGASAERVVDLWHALTVHLAPVVDVHVSDLRSGRNWEGALCALPDVREAVGRLRLALAAYGGLEVSVYTDSDQLTLTPELALVIYARTDRWTFLLDGMGLTERSSLPAPTWMPSRAALRPEPQLAHAVQAAAERLQLHEITR